MKQTKTARRENLSAAGCLWNRLIFQCLLQIVHDLFQLSFLLFWIGFLLQVFQIAQQKANPALELLDRKSVV